VEGVRMRDGMIQPIAPTTLAQPPVDGELWYQPSTQAFYYAQQGTKIIRHYTNNHVAGRPPRWLDNNRIQLPSGLEAMATDSSTGNQALIRVPSTGLELNLNTAGVLGLDNGTRTNDTFYYVWLLADANMNVSAVFSTSPTALSTSIASSWIYRRRLPVVCKTYPTSITLGGGTTAYTKAGALVKFVILYWGATVHQQYVVTTSTNSGSDSTGGWLIGETNVLYDGTGAVDVSNPFGYALNLAKWLPPIDVLALQFAWAIRNASGDFRLSDSAGNRFCSISNQGTGLTPMMPLDANRIVSYYRTVGANSLLHLDVVGFILAT
jgi:hypothetical protein